MAAANVLTGRTVTLTIDSTAFTDQIVSAVLTPSDNAITGVTIGGPYAKQGTTTWTLDVEMLADWGATSSICEALWADAETGTNVAVTFVSVTGASFAFSVVPVFPSVGGPVDGAQTVTLSMPVHGAISETFT
jgi:acyl-CoA hydrolase